jgi:hypothetical protein
MSHRFRRMSMLAVAALVTVGIATAAAHDSRPCHPDLPGTRTLTVTGAVTSYRFAGPGTLAVRGARVVRWNYAAATTTTASVGRAGSAALAAKLVAAQGDRVVRVALAPAGVDAPDRLDVFNRATGAKIASWPLIDRPARVALYGGIALLSGATRGAVYALRISDGRIVEVGIAPTGDRPVIGPDGIAFQDDQFLPSVRQAPGPNHAMLKLVPLAAIEKLFSVVDRQVVTPGPIRAVGMDGQRVVFAVHDPAGRCDRVWFWIDAWNFLAHATHRSGPTCLPTHAAGGITNVAIGGNRFIWTTRYGHRTRVIAQSIVGCSEWVVARPAGTGAPVAALAGDGKVLAYALASGTVGLVPGAWQGKVISQSPTHVAGMSVDSDRIATLYRNGTVTVMTDKGAPVSSFAAGGARAIALRGDTLAVLQSGRLAIYNATTGALVQSWPVAAGARTVDLAYGIAVLGGSGNAWAVNVDTGHAARLLHAGGSVAAQIDAPGAVVQFNAGGHGHVRLIPMRTLEARTT